MLGRGKKERGREREKTTSKGRTADAVDETTTSSRRECKPGKRLWVLF